MSLQNHLQSIFSLFPFPPATHNFIPPGHPERAECLRGEPWPQWGWLDQPQRQRKPGAHVVRDTLLDKLGVLGSTESCTPLQHSKPTVQENWTEQSRTQPCRAPSQSPGAILPLGSWDPCPTVLPFAKVESHGKLPSKSWLNFPEMGKAAGLSCLQCSIQLGLYLLSAFEMYHPLQDCWLLCKCGWLWLLPVHFGFSSRGLQFSTCWILPLLRRTPVFPHFPCSYCCASPWCS